MRSCCARIMIQEVVVWLEKRVDDKLWLEPALDSGVLHRFADCVALRIGGSVTNVWDLISCTKVEICRPVEKQEVWFTSHSRSHRGKEQAITTPDGL